MIDWLNNIDTETFLSLNSFRWNFADTFFVLFSGKWIWIPMYASILYVLFRDFGWKQAILMAVCVAAAITLADQIGNSVMRPFFERPRPANEDSPIADLAIYVEGHKPGGHYGFPSCHAANTFALASLISLWIRRRALTVFLFLWALITCYSRIYLAAHYPGDLFVGALLGIAISILLYYLSILIGNKILKDGFRVGESGASVMRLYRATNFYPSYSIILVGVLTILYICIVSL